MYGISKELLMSQRRSNDLLVQTLLANYEGYMKFADRQIASHYDGTPLGGDLVSELYENLKKHREDECPETKADAQRIICSLIAKYSRNKKYRYSTTSVGAGETAKKIVPLWNEEGEAIDVEDATASAAFEQAEDDERAAIEWMDDTLESEADKVDKTIDVLIKLYEKMVSTELNDNLSDDEKAIKNGNLLIGVTAMAFKEEHSDEFKQAFRIKFLKRLREMHLTV